MNQQNVLNIIDWLKDNDIAVWVDGRLGVDAPLSEITHDHNDLSIGWI